MSGSKIEDNSLNKEEKNFFQYKWNNKFNEINKQQYDLLLHENKVLKQLINDYLVEKNHKVTKDKLAKSDLKKKTKNDYGFYVKIILAITVIMLSLAFHIVYLSVASCLYYNNGSSKCWIKSWLGMPVNASFFIDLTLYLLIGVQLVLIILILKSKIQSISVKK